MGLDMYLSRKKYVGANYEHRQVKGEIKINIGDKELPIDFNKVSYIEEEVGYWRKANQIHNWFVENCQDGVDNCSEYWIPLKKLEELLNICKEIKEKAILKEGKITNGYKGTENGWEPILEDGKYIENKEVCEKLLPTTSGCFFGSTDYDEYYMHNIENTIKILEPLIEEEKALNNSGIYCDYYYQSSW